MNKTRMGLFGAAALLALLTTTTPLRAQTIYREIFPNDTGTALSVGSANWQVNQTTAGTTVDVSAAGSVLISPLNGRPATFVPINSNPISAELARGFYKDSSAGGTGFNELMWTSEFSIPINTYLNSQVDWWQGNDAAADTDRVAVRVNTTWFVSAQTFAQASGLGGDGNFAASSVKMSLAVSGAQWNLLNFTADTQMTRVNAPTSLPTNIGDVTAFGLYVDNKSSSLRFDTYQINTPEPGAFPLFSLGALLMGGQIALKRRRAARR